jgi:sugar phosphate isomerase/epimerase
MKRRKFLTASALASSALVMPNQMINALFLSEEKLKQLPFKISISQWAFETEIFGKGRENYKEFKHNLEHNPDAVLQGSMKNTDIIDKALSLGVNGVDLVSTMMYSKRDDKKWLRQFSKQAKDKNVQFVCLMADTQTKIGDHNALNRQKSVDDHKHWIEAAKEMDCEHIRVNPFGTGTYLQQLNQCAESLQHLAEFAENTGIKLTVENHGHPSSNGAWLDMLIELTNHSNLGLFLDFGNFFMGGFNARPRRWYDATQGILDLAPHTIGVSAKARDISMDSVIKDVDYDFSTAEIIKNGFNGWMSAEYAGKDLTNTQGSLAIIKKLETLQKIHSK